jgi:2-methylcitrate dehydratase PrpD
VSHAFIEAAQQIMSRDGIGSADVASIRAHVGVWGREMCEPLAMRCRPQTASAAMNNIPFMVAKAIANGRVTLTDFDSAGRKQPEALQMTERFSYVLDSSLSSATGLEPGVLDVVTNDGHVHSARIEHPRGHPSRPLTFEDVAEKFTDNARYAPDPATPDRIGAIIDDVHQLDELPDVRALIRKIVPQQCGSQLGES